MKIAVLWTAELAMKMAIQQQIDEEKLADVMTEVIEMVQRDAVESCAVNAETVEHSCSHTTCSGGAEVAANIRKLKP